VVVTFSVVGDDGAAVLVVVVEVEVVVLAVACACRCKFNNSIGKYGSKNKVVVVGSVVVVAVVVDVVGALVVVVSTTSGVVVEATVVVVVSGVESTVVVETSLVVGSKVVEVVVLGVVCLNNGYFIPGFFLYCGPTCSLLELLELLILTLVTTSDEDFATITFAKVEAPSSDPAVVEGTVVELDVEEGKLVVLGT
jgi:hypothetical protein